ncbi:Rhomboid family intramembrane serine protease [Sulfidibacter corallicola]|uniref:Rhomboid family intramembrane serine protease n=1 Tax=Sulfidibacter corallicola TaxID=2818388 RepID=A0A8A4TTY7_SULCO|nr:rhomboid family intramembrane serine protease [Sulfidibacter corallicola]QTD52578.1 rhomboid family intramembrane serine protease [Sulfidibacter corallicola]
MTQWERFYRQFKNQVRNWLDSMKSEPKQDKPNIKMCPSCGNFVNAKDRHCGYCDAVFETAIAQGNPREKASSQTEPLNPTFAIFGICAFVYVVSIILTSKFPDYDPMSNLWSPALYVLHIMGSNSAELTLFRLELWRLGTYMFLHGGLLHIAMNLMALASLGSMTYHNFQSRRFWLISLICGVAGGVLSSLSIFLMVTPSASVGFSGALFGYLGANWVYFYRHGYFEMADRFKNFMIWANVICILISFLTPMNIDNFAHIGGMLAGMALGRLFTSTDQPRHGEWVERALLVMLVGFIGYGQWRVIQAIHHFLN